MTYSEALAFLDTLPNWEKLARAGHRFGLDHFRRFLKRIGSPELRLKNPILVAGTKGKGSTTALIESVLRKAGKRTGLYTSPHLLDVRERIRVFGEVIPQRDFARLVEHLRPATTPEPITWFEALTALAFLYFAEQNLDYTILEVGLGGRLDATNTVNPILSVITRIGLDHTEILGKTLGRIAREKAGIMRRKGLVVVAEQRPAALREIRAAAGACRTSLIYVPDFLSADCVEVTPHGTFFAVTLGQNVTLPARDLMLGLAGRHQVENALTAIAVLTCLSRITGDRSWFGPALGLGLLEASAPARCQIVRPTPLLVIDAAHNPDSIAALVQALKDLGSAKVTVILGLLNDKPARQILQLLKPVTRRLIAAQPDSPRALPAAELARIAAGLGMKSAVTDSLARTLRDTSEPAVVTGSFYLAGEALRILKAGPQ